jgi:hypothetical protein
MNRVIAFLAVVLTTGVASAAPVITSITPNTSPVGGGIHVTIKGDGFTAPPHVFFASTPAASARLIDAQTLDVVTPAHLPGTFYVAVDQTDGNTFLLDAFTFSGDPSDAFESVLLPIFTQPAHGAFGSEFITDFHAFNLSREQTLSVYGLASQMSCSGIVILPPPFDSRDMPFPVAPRSNLVCFARTGNPGRLLWMPAGTADLLAVNLSVVDVSRSLMTAGVEIPVVRMRNFRTGTIALLGVPRSGTVSGFRQQLRIYSLEPEPLTVNVTYLSTTVPVQLKGGSDIFDPAYASFSDFLPPPNIIDEVPPTMDIFIESADPTRHIWAFATATNNDTQLITTISSN